MLQLHSKQITTFATIDNNVIHSFNQWIVSTEKRTDIIELYKYSLSLTLGSIGGEKEVQAGDEILALLSVIYRDQIFDSSLSSSISAAKSSFSVSVTSYDNDIHRLYLQWSEVLLLGEQTSPWNYVFHLEHLETARVVGNNSMLVYHVLFINSTIYIICV